MRKVKNTYEDKNLFKGNLTKRRFDLDFITGTGGFLFDDYLILARDKYKNHRKHQEFLFDGYLIMKEKQLIALVNELIKQPNESEWVEFKQNYK